MRQRDRLRATEVVDSVAVAPLKRGLNSPHNIRHIRVIPARRSIAKNRDRFPGRDEAGEFVNRQIGLLSWAIDREKAQTGDWHPIEVLIGMVDQFPSALGGGVGADRLIDIIFLAERHLLLIAIDTGAGGEEEFG